MEDERVSGGSRAKVCEGCHCRIIGFSSLLKVSLPEVHKEENDRLGDDIAGKTTRGGTCMQLRHPNRPRGLSFVPVLTPSLSCYRSIFLPFYGELQEAEKDGARDAIAR